MVPSGLSPAPSQATLSHYVHSPALFLNQVLKVPLSQRGSLTQGFHSREMGGVPQGQELSPAWLPAAGKPTQQAPAQCHCNKDSGTRVVSWEQGVGWGGDSPRGRVPSPG